MPLFDQPDGWGDAMAGWLSSTRLQWEMLDNLSDPTVKPSSGRYDR